MAAVVELEAVEVPLELRQLPVDLVELEETAEAVEAAEAVERQMEKAAMAVPEFFIYITKRRFNG
jgi:hypothetical protein